MRWIKPAPRRKPTRLALALAATLGVAVLAAGCSGPKCDTCGTPYTCVDNDQSTPTQVVESLVCAYKVADCAGYSALLADDFSFWFDPATRPTSVPESWGRGADSTATCRFLGDNRIRVLLITLTYGAEEPDTRAGHTGGRHIRVTNAQLEADLLLNNGGSLSYIVEGDAQDFYFRRGRTPQDTLAASPTAQKWYLVEWRDLGDTAAPGVVAARAAGPAPVSPRPAVAPLTWGDLKAIYQ